MTETITFPATFSHGEVTVPAVCVACGRTDVPLLLIADVTAESGWSAVCAHSYDDGVYVGCGTE